MSKKTEKNIKKLCDITFEELKKHCESHYSEKNSCHCCQFLQKLKTCPSGHYTDSELEEIFKLKI